YRLIGIIYYGGVHFTSRVIDSDGRVWYYDGIETQHTCQYEGTVADIEYERLTSAKSRVYSTVIYARI
ncbi:hypothetical protein BC629DRAFT_1261903, partial [Irpex lacteus]